MENYYLIFALLIVVGIFFVASFIKKKNGNKHSEKFLLLIEALGVSRKFIDMLDFKNEENILEFIDTIVCVMQLTNNIIIEDEIASYEIAYKIIYEKLDNKGIIIDDSKKKLIDSLIECLIKDSKKINKYIEIRGDIENEQNGINN